VTTATAAERFGRFAGGLSFADLPPEVVQAVELQVLDTLGCGLAAAGNPVAAAASAVAAIQGGVAEASAIGGVVRIPAAAAAMANATRCHALDFDMTHSGARCHIPTVVVPAALAQAEASGRDTREALAAIVAASELVARLGAAVPGGFHRRGFHPTSVCGVFGAATASAMLRGLGPAGITTALGVAGSMASGLFAYLQDGAPTKPLHAGWAAHGGLWAAALAEAGARGPAGVLEGRFGLLHAFLGVEAFDSAELCEGLGERWETLAIAFKPYPACHSMHGVLGAFIALDERPQPDAIEEIVATVHPDAVSLILEPAADKIRPRTDYEAKFSLQYSLAALAVHGTLGISSYSEEAIADPRVLALSARVRYRTKRFPTYPGAFPGAVTVRMRDGRVLEAELPYQLGSVENPMSPADVRAKFADNASPVLSEDDLQRLLCAFTTIERGREMGAILARLRRAAV
jgi:2-methylcitrate dehydratase PrpD